MNTILQLCEEIRMPGEVTKQVLAYEKQADWQRLGKAMDMLFNRKTWEKGREELQNALGEDEKGIKMLCCMLRCGLITREHYREQGIAEEIFTATMGCFSRFVEEYRESYGE